MSAERFGLKWTVKAWPLSCTARVPTRKRQVSTRQITKEGPMSDELEQTIEARYRNSFGRVAGYLPKNRAAIDAWQSNLKREVAKRRAKGKGIVSPSVAALARLIELDGIVRMYVTQMIEEVWPKYKKIDDVAELLAALDHITKHAPRYNWNPADQVFFPMSSLFAYMMMTA